MRYTPAANRYESMKYNRCGKSGLLLPAVSLGLWHNFGGINTFENMRDMSKTAFDCGITHFDLANNYGPPPGSAEENFGRILKEDFRNYRDELIISTKAGYGMWPGPYGDWGSRKYLISSLDQSLKRLQLDYVDIFYHHRPDPNTPLEETMTALHDIVKQGKALYVGISNYNAEDTKKAAQIMRELGTPLLIHQPNYSMLNRWIEDGLQEILEEEGMGCIAFSPLAQGKLTTKYINGIPEDSRAAGASVFLTKEAITEDLLTKVRALNKVAEERGQTLAQMALAWVLRKNKVTSVLIGASKSSQILENVRIVEKLEFTEDELTRIDEILNK
ncbi:L-glyceraldehyde 3-phosphate reductase [Clostridium thermarum]|uniref:L-glyceraldehyde 3-phosphate reductase n=1 Tax=Clostridium thermarum TaxID=1716543 RepID=UPI001122E3F6|nr:L-glyceraldehyde 3-phosphate reductase [Clostridium thermarum]